MNNRLLISIFAFTMLAVTLLMQATMPVSASYEQAIKDKAIIESIEENNTHNGRKKMNFDTNSKDDAAVNYLFEPSNKELKKQKKEREKRARQEKNAQKNAADKKARIQSKLKFKAQTKADDDLSAKRAREAMKQHHTASFWRQNDNMFKIWGSPDGHSANAANQANHEDNKGKNSLDRDQHRWNIPFYPELNW